MRRRNIVGGGALALTVLALVCIPRHLPSSVSQASPVPANFYAKLESNRLTLRGTLPDAATRNRILQKAHTLYDGKGITLVDQFIVDPDVTSANWLTSLPAVLPSLDHMAGHGSIIIDGRSIVLNGRVLTPEHKSAILETVAPLTSIGLALEDHVVSDQTTSPTKLQGAITEYLSRNPIDFDSNQSTLTPRSSRVLNDLAVLLKHYPPASIEIGGHTDSYGEPDYNKELSKRRAETVRRYLLEQGVRHRLTVIGYGDSRPVTSQQSRQALRRNRRIELLVREQRDL